MRTYKPFEIRRTPRRLVYVRVVDRYRPKDARWQLQQAITRAAGFHACRGLTDRAVRNGRRHAFWVGDPMIGRFLRDIEKMVVSGRLVAFVDGRQFRRLRR